MSQPFYKITYSGLLHSIHATDSTETRVFMFYLVKTYGIKSFSLSAINHYFAEDKPHALKTIYYLMNRGWIDIDDTPDTVDDTYIDAGLQECIASVSDLPLVLADCYGLPVAYAGFDKFEAECLSAMMCGYMQTAHKSQQLAGTDSGFPLSIGIRWKELALVVYQICMANLRFYIVFVEDDTTQHEHVLHVISCLARRYYES